MTTDLEEEPGIRVWIDIENPPQVQYLSPFKGRFEHLGAEVVVTAKDNGITHELLRQRGIDFEPIGSRLQKSTLRKVLGVMTRSQALAALFKGDRRPSLLVSASRPAALAARRLGVPAFVIDDYEYAEVRLYGRAGCWLLHPDVIPADVFCERGVSRGRLIPMRGLKEDISFHGLDLDSIPAHDAAPADERLVRVLFRPPAEQSHYYDRRSGGLAASLLAYLAGREDVLVLFAPRYEWQGADLDRLTWRNEPIRLDGAIQFASLLKSIDAVVSSGGTMVREAAYVGIPAYSILRSRIGAVDRYLESIGRLQILSSPDDFRRIEFRKLESLSRLDLNPRLLDEVVDEILRRSQVHAPRQARFRRLRSRRSSGAERAELAVERRS